MLQERPLQDQLPDHQAPQKGQNAQIHPRPQGQGTPEKDRVKTVSAIEGDPPLRV